MEYKLKQYSYNSDTSNAYMTTLNNAQFVTIKDTISQVKDEQCLYNNSSYIAGESYYFFGIIQQNNIEREVNIKLTNKVSSTDPTLVVDADKQYIKTLRIPSKKGTGSEKEYYSFEFIFTPIVNFNALVFERNPNDSNNLRIGCIDIALLRNMLSEKNGPMYAESPLIRFSIQSVPSFLMCLNGEAIRIPRNGIYEIKNGIILIDSFTPVAHCQSQSNDFVNWKKGNSNIPCINSEIYNNPDRKLFPFTVDYLYYQIELI